MGLFLSFLGGAAKGITDSIEKEEESAKEQAKLSVNALYKAHQQNMIDNRKLQSELDTDKQLFKSTFANASDEQIAALINNRPVADILRKNIEAGKIDSSMFDINQFVTVAQNNPAMAAKVQRTQQLVDLPDTATKAAEEISKRPGGLRSFIQSFGETAGDTAAAKYARQLGSDIDTLKSSSRLTTKSTEGIKYQMDMLADKPKTEDQLISAIASTSNEAVRESLKGQLKQIKAVKEEFTPAQTKFANHVADIKNRYMFGTPEQRANAKPEYDKLLADVRAEAAAKKAGEGNDDKIPKLGTLSTFTSGAVARKVAEVHGDLIRSKQLALIEKADGSVSLEYTGDNPEARTQINNTAYNAAKNALSLYIAPTGEPMTRDVAAVLNTYVPQSVMKAPAAQTPTPAKPAAPVAVDPIRKEAEAAIASGADRAAVAKRYKERTGKDF